MAENNQKIIVQMNFPVPITSPEEIKKILNNEKLNQMEDMWVNWLEDFLGIPKKSFTKIILDRFAKINTKETFMNVVPSIQRLLNPLRYACKAFCFGLYGPSIAMSAVAAESLQILIWEMNGISIKNRVLSKKDEDVLFGKKFEDLNQVRRIKILKTFDFITSEQENNFDYIRKKRNGYLHPWKDELRNEEEDALICYQKTFVLFREITGVKIKNAGSIEANPLLIKWMNRQKKDT